MHHCHWTKTDLPSFLRQLDYNGPIPAVWKEKWEQIGNSCPSSPLFFLEDGYTQKMADFYKLQNPFLEAYEKAVACLCEDALLRQWTYFLFALCSHDDDFTVTKVFSFPTPPGLNKRPGGKMTQAIAVLAGHEDMLRRLDQRGVTHLALSNNQACIGARLNGTGENGLPFWSMGWALYYIHVKWARLDRLAYELSRFADDMVGYRHVKTGENLLLLSNACKVRPDGQPVGSDGHMNDEGAWQGELTEEGDTLSGYPVKPDGTICHEKITLPRHLWKKQFQKGDWRLAIHIADQKKAGRLTPESVQQSLSQAYGYFTKYYPECDLKVMTCHSWLLSAAIPRILPPDSYLVQFVKRFYLYPFPQHPSNFMNNLFKSCGDIPLADYPENTTFQRNAKKLLLQGEILRSGAGFICFEDVK